MVQVLRFTLLISYNEHSFFKLVMTKVIFYTFFVHLILWGKAAQPKPTRSLPYPTGQGATNKSLFVPSVVGDEQSERTPTPCIVNFNHSNILGLVKLGKKKEINIVDIKFLLNTTQLPISETQWIWVNKIGLEIVFVLGMQNVLVKWTLNAGRQATSIVILENPRNCVRSHQNPDDFLAGELLKRVSFSGLENELCYKTKNNPRYSKCCDMQSFSSNQSDIHCAPNSVSKSQFVKVLQTLNSRFAYFLFIFGGNFLLYTTVFLPWRDSPGNRWYFKLKESPMSLSSIFSILFQ